MLHFVVPQGDEPSSSGDNFSILMTFIFCDHDHFALLNIAITFKVCN
jgi:hypothetical protein